MNGVAANRRWKMKRILEVILLSLVVSGPATALGQRNRGPTVKHDPVTVGVRGQDITIVATVTAGAYPVREASLYYATSPDAAPYKLPMQASGTGVFFGTIPANLLVGVDRVSYYIEATDTQDVSSETPWYPVQIREPKETPASAGGSGAGGRSWVVPAIIAGGAAAVVGGAFVLSDSGGGDSGGGGGGGSASNNYVGTYSGTSTICFEENGVPSCSTGAATITIDGNGTVRSDDLLPGSSLAGQLSGNTFSLIGTVNDAATGRQGSIVFGGTVVNNQIEGIVTGEATTATGSGTYSGRFSATRI